MAAKKKGKETQTQCGVHETSSAGCGSERGRREQTDSAHRANQKTVGLHQEEWAPGQKEKNKHQRGRQA